LDPSSLLLGEVGDDGVVDGLSFGLVDGKDDASSIDPLLERRAGAVGAPRSSMREPRRGCCGTTRAAGVASVRRFCSFADVLFRGLRSCVSPEAAERGGKTKALFATGSKEDTTLSWILGDMAFFLDDDLITVIFTSESSDS